MPIRTDSSIPDNIHACFDRTALNRSPLSERDHDLNMSCIRTLEDTPITQKDFFTVADKIYRARKMDAPVILMMGAHVIRSGVQPFIIDLMQKGYISCIAMNGAGVIHDYEFSLIGATTESVSRYIKNGKFGLWEETGIINSIVKEGAGSGWGLGETVGKKIHEGIYPHKNISLLAAGYRLGIPITVHVGIGYDIVFEHPNCDGAAYGATSYKDFLIFTRLLESLDNGVVMNFGSAIMAPEIFLKALSMARNKALSDNRTISRFTTLVCDLVSLPGDFRTEPDKENPFYYFRPWKTMLVRTVADGGESFYIKGKHEDTIPQLWTAVMNKDKGRQV